MFTFLGILFTLSIGILLRHTYEWSGRSIFLAFPSPTNQSIFERLKIFFTPYMIWTLTEYEAFGYQTKNFIPAKTISVLAGMLIMILFFGCFRKYHGTVTDAAALILATATATALSRLLLQVSLLSGFTAVLICNTMFIALMIIFAAFTIYPQKGFLFAEHTA